MENDSTGGVFGREGGAESVSGFLTSMLWQSVMDRKLEQVYRYRKFYFLDHTFDFTESVGVTLENSLIPAIVQIRAERHNSERTGCGGGR